MLSTQDDIVHPQNPTLPRGIIEVTLMTDPDVPTNIQLDAANKLNSLGYERPSGTPVNGALNIITDMEYYTICAGP